MNTVPRRQKGVVLVVALVLLVAITLLSLAGISTTTLELLMATNQQARTDAFQQAEAGIDAVSSDLYFQYNFAVAGTIGAQRCTPDFHDARYYDANDEVTCGSPNLRVPAAYELTYSRAVVERLPPLLQTAPRFMPSSVETVRVATFKVDSRYDARDIGGGRAEHNQGIIVTTRMDKRVDTRRGVDIDI